MSEKQRYRTAIGTDIFLRTILNSFFGVNRRDISKKISFGPMRGLLEGAYLMSSVNTMMLIREFIERATKENWSVEEMKGQFDLYMIDAWNEMCLTSFGIKHFSKLTLDDILKDDEISSIVAKKSKNVFVFDTLGNKQ